MAPLGLKMTDIAKGLQAKSESLCLLMDIDNIFFCCASMVIF